MVRDAKESLFSLTLFTDSLRYYRSGISLKPEINCSSIQINLLPNVECLVFLLCVFLRFVFFDHFIIKFSQNEVNYNPPNAASSTTATAIIRLPITEQKSCTLEWIYLLNNSLKKKKKIINKNKSLIGNLFTHLFDLEPESVFF